jgi:WD40 repeat protein
MTPAFSPDGATVLVPFIDGTLALFDAATGAKLATATAGQKNPIHAAFSPDGKVAMVWGREFSPEVVDGKTLATIAKLEAHKRPLSTVTMSRTHVAIASRDKTITVWDMATWKLVHHLHGDTNVVEDVAFDPAGKKLVSTSRDGSARVWDVATGEMLVNLVGHQGAIRLARFTPDGTRLVTGSADGTARLWDVASGVALATFEGHQRELTGIAVTDDLVVTGGADATARTYPLTANRRVLTGSDQVPSAVAYSADGRRLLSAARQGAWVWDAATGTPLHKLAGALDAKLDPRDPSRMVAVFPTELQLLFDGAVIKRAPVSAGLVGFLRDGKRLVITTGEPSAIVQIWDPSSGAITKLAEHATWISTLSIADDLVVTGSDDSTARITKPSTGASIKLVHDKRVISASIDPTRNYVVTGSADLKTRVWDVTTGALVHTLPAQDSPVVIAFDDRGHVLTAGRFEASAQVWNLGDGSLVATLEGHNSRIEGAAFVMKDLIATAGDETLRIWDHEGRQLSVSRSHAIAISGFALRPDGGAIATGAYDRTITLDPIGLRHRDLVDLRRLTRCLPMALDGGRLVPKKPSC